MTSNTVVELTESVCLHHEFPQTTLHSTCQYLNVVPESMNPKTADTKLSGAPGACQRCIEACVGTDIRICQFLRLSTKCSKFGHLIHNNELHHASVKETCCISYTIQKFVVYFTYKSQLNMSQDEFTCMAEQNCIIIHENAATL